MREQFRLEAVLGYKSARLDVARAELAAALRQLGRQQRYIEALSAAERSVMDTLTQLLATSPVDLGRVREANRQVAGLREATAKAKSVAAALEAEVAMRRQAAVVAQQEHKALLRLRERHWARVLAEERRQETRRNDEVAMAQVCLRRRGD